jgi:hypothetical protein
VTRYPVSAGKAGQPGRVGVGGRQAGDAEDSDGGSRCAVRVGDVAFDEGNLPNVRKRQVGWGGEDADGTAFDPAVALAGVGVADRGFAPGQGVERGVEFRLVFLDG